ncbi:YbhB/YbcL family Raf kinase inhibitor-like protein [Candidatus Cerribacteria bacterium 'Amazon FNV 2010 28 9']|uniref:YbhB/YbcL family Raf kinase inhibitor-like protein n=1 Tax=Candidatus Cerribacteria bacterium 'Amazon FNV 2010 28 9' TaxID=2081795 RepID=A0A317JPC8_9BACT|nr:MAG: YbhB/YbcL family Raf kinase inhibitor-like protein [Candidatus Cerribacteria bacterium 'Amazon FNV 2010 28 9']
MTITSLDFQPNQPIPAEFTCDGSNTAPTLEFTDIPINAKSLVLIMDDPDSPSGVWTHWMMYNIDPLTTILEQPFPSGVAQGINTFGEVVYDGPCPHNGLHHYVFTLYALDEALSFPKPPTRSEIEYALTGHILQSAQLIGTYERQ